MTRSNGRAAGLALAGTAALLGLLLLAGCPNRAKNAAGGGSDAASQAGSGQRDPAMMAKFQKFREEHKNTFALTELTGKLGRMERDGITPLTAAQAKSILDILTPLRTKEKLTQDEAKATIQQINAALTEAQLSALDKMPSGRNGMRQRNGQGGSGGQGGFRPGGQNGQGGQGGPNGAQGNRPRFDPDAMKDFNPFNPDKGGMGRGERMKAFFDMLEKKAKG